MKRFVLEMDEGKVTSNTYTTYGAALKALNGGEETVATTQVVLLTTSLFEMGYNVFVHLENGKTIEIKLGDNECTDREIRPGHCLYKLLLAGEFR